jgi:acyl carrier protein
MPRVQVDQVLPIIASVHHVPVESVSLDSTFEQLGIDSLEAQSVVFAMEEAFDITIPDDCLQRNCSIRELIDRIDAALASPPAPVPTGVDSHS